MMAATTAPKMAASCLMVIESHVLPGEYVERTMPFKTHKANMMNEKVPDTGSCLGEQSAAAVAMHLAQRAREAFAEGPASEVDLKEITHLLGCLLLAPATRPADVLALVINAVQQLRTIYPVHETPLNLEDIGPPDVALALLETAVAALEKMSALSHHAFTGEPRVIN